MHSQPFKPQRWRNRTEQQVAALWEEWPDRLRERYIVLRAYALRRWVPEGMKIYKRDRVHAASWAVERILLEEEGRLDRDFPK